MAQIAHYKHAWCCCSPGDLVGGCRATSLYQHQPCAAAAELPSLPALRTHNYPTCSNILFGRSKISHLLHWLKAHMRVASIFHLKSSGKISMGRINRSKYKYLNLHKCLSVAFAARCCCRPLFSLCTKPLITDKTQLQQHESVTLLLRIVTICYNLP